MMKRLLIVTVVIIALTGCGTTHSIVKEVSHDTLYVNTVQYDSVYIDQWQFRDRSSDTIYLEKVRLEYKYRFLKDTVSIVQVDSIPVIREVQVTKTVKSVPWIYRATFWFSVIVIVIVIVYILIRVIRSRK